jgi:hypothetical protein
MNKADVLQKYVLLHTKYETIMKQHKHGVVELTPSSYGKIKAMLELLSSMITDITDHL